MKTVIQRWGNSLGIRIPSLYAKQLNLTSGSTVEVREENGVLVIVPAKQDLADLLSRVDVENLHEPIDTGPVLGREAW